MILKFPLTPDLTPTHCFKPFRWARSTKFGDTLVCYHLWFRRPDSVFSNRGNFNWYDNAEEAETFLREHGFEGQVIRWNIDPEAYGGEHPIWQGPYFPWQGREVVAVVTKGG